MITSSILTDIANHANETLPSDERSAVSLVRRVLKNTSADSWNSFSPESYEYLQSALKAMKSKAKIPMPSDLKIVEGDALPTDELARSAAEADARVDIVEDNASVDETQEVEEVEPLPEGMKCESNHKIYSVASAVEMLKSGTLRIPEFQRKFIWKRPQRQGFLESIFEGLPIPSVLFGVEPNGSNERYLLDGAQRLQTLKLFLEGGETVYGRKFSELNPKDQNKFLFAGIVADECFTERKNWPVIFRRRNKGGQPLNDIEVRRACYDHPLLLMLDDMTENHQLWINLFGRKDRYQGLAAMLAAVALHTNYAEYQKPRVQYLDRFCDRLMEEPECVDVDVIKERLDNILFALNDIGKDAFKITKSVNAGMLECIFHAGFIALEKQPDMSAEDLAKLLTETRKKLLANETFINGCTIDTSGRDPVMARMTETEKTVEALLAA